jgi:hypothetical protein
MAAPLERRSDIHCLRMPPSSQVATQRQRGTNRSARRRHNQQTTDIEVSLRARLEHQDHVERVGFIREVKERYQHMMSHAAEQLGDAQTTVIEASLPEQVDLRRNVIHVRDLCELIERCNAVYLTERERREQVREEMDHAAQQALQVMNLSAERHLHGPLNRAIYYPPYNNQLPSGHVNMELVDEEQYQRGDTNYATWTEFIGEALFSSIRIYSGPLPDPQLSITLSSSPSGRVIVERVDGSETDQVIVPVDNATRPMRERRELGSWGLNFNCQPHIESICYCKVADAPSDNMCSICCESFECDCTAPDSDQRCHPVSQLAICNHVFHYACLLPWFDQNNTCPLCRRVIACENALKEVD